MSAQFDETNHIKLGTGLNVSGNEMSISAWVFLDSDVGPNDARVISKGTGTGADDVPWALRISASSDRAQFSVRKGGTGQITSLSGVATLGQGVWHHLVGVCEDDELRIYQNNVLENAQAITAGDIDTNADETWIGDQPTSNNRPLDGRIADLRVYDAVLSVDRIASIFHGQGRDGDVDDLLYRWLLNEGAPGAVIGVGDIVNVGPSALANGDGSGSPTWSTDEVVNYRRRTQ